MERLICVELRRLNNLASRCCEKRRQDRQDTDEATATNGWIIGYIGRQTEKGIAVYQRDLEERFGITRSTASRVVALMVRKGLVSRQRVPEDGRVRRLVLTERAWAMKRRMDEDRARFEKALRRGMTEEEIGCLFGLLDRMQRNLMDFDGKEGNEPA